jgi:GNAT superfamily N-acetyltransferase
MPDTESIAQQFTFALAGPGRDALTALLTEDAGLRVYAWNGWEAYRPREHGVARLRDEWEAWPDARIEVLSELPGEGRTVLEFRIQATDPATGRYIKHIRSAFLTLAEGRIAMIDLYCPEPVPSAHRKGWIAPASLSEAEVNDLFATLHYAFDVREWMPPRMRGRMSLREMSGGSGDPHPGSNGVGGVRWPAEEADAKIEAVIERHRQQGVGFNWLVAPTDTPADLAQRLERHGLVLAGEQAMMARLGLDNLDDIPVNPDVTVEFLDGSDDKALQERIEIIAACFNWTPEQVAERGPGMAERIKDPRFRDEEFNYLARLDGVAVADGRLLLSGGVAYLGGAGTLPAYRGRRLYSTLLRRRLEVARDHGYHVAAIHAEPMSRRIVTRYGFKEYAKSYLYAWMPVIDMDVIRSLVPDE